MSNKFHTVIIITNHLLYYCKNRWAKTWFLSLWFA